MFYDFTQEERDAYVKFEEINAQYWKFFSVEKDMKEKSKIAMSWLKKLINFHTDFCGNNKAWHDLMTLQSFLREQIKH